MLVQIEYEDGRFSMKEYTSGHANAGIIPAEIEDDDWREYVAHCAKDQDWQKFILDVDNERQN